LIMADKAGNQYYNQEPEVLYDFKKESAVGPWKIALPKPDEFLKLYLKRTIPQGIPWYFEPVRFAILGPVIHEKRIIKRQKDGGIVVHELWVAFYNNSETAQNLINYNDFVMNEVKESLERGEDKNVDFIPKKLVYNFKDEIELGAILKWKGSGIMSGICFNIKPSYVYKGCVNGTFKDLTVSELDHYISDVTNYAIDIIFQPAGWVIKSQDGGFKAGINLSLEFIDVRAKV
jgi:hypothetical protein